MLYWFRIKTWTNWTEKGNSKTKEHFKSEQKGQTIQKLYWEGWKTGKRFNLDASITSYTQNPNGLNSKYQLKKKPKSGRNYIKFSHCSFYNVRGDDNEVFLKKT